LSKISKSASRPPTEKTTPIRTRTRPEAVKYLGYSVSADNDWKREEENKTSTPALHLYLDVQMNEGLDLKNAHTIIDSFENRIKNEIPGIYQITTHIETESDAYQVIGTEKKPTKYDVENIKKLALSVDAVIDCKDIGIVDINSQQHITLTIKVKSTPDKTVNTIDDAHQLATQIQNLIIKQTGASRVVVHTEPAP
jgi:divalent metal cation (Fe/Co/Zn/Cd) transporter